MPREISDLFAHLSRSAFRSRFRLAKEDREYLKRKGWDLVLSHAADFVQNRLAPASPKNDGRQTPIKGHPVFTAQHATATCCRGCLAKWHGIAKGDDLDDHQVDYLVNVIRYWREGQVEECN